ncbi:MAG: hypothetical protein ABI351_13885 [Herbaspirillum sp.]
MKHWLYFAAGAAISYLILRQSEPTPQSSVAGTDNTQLVSQPSLTSPVQAIQAPRVDNADQPWSIFNPAVISTAQGSAP